MRVDASLDAWSVGMVLAELVSLDAPLKPVFNQVAQRIGLQTRQSKIMKEFMQQVAHMDTVPLPKCLDKLNNGFARMIRDGLLLMAPRSRSTMAECLEEEFMKPFDRRTLQLQWMPIGSFENLPAASMSIAAAEYRASPEVSPSASETLGSTTPPEEPEIFKGISFKDDATGTARGSILEWRKAIQLRDHSVQPVTKSSSRQKVYPGPIRQAQGPDVVESL